MVGFLESPKKELKTLQQDNHDKLKISISSEDLERGVKSITKWRKDVLDRFYKLGSKDYDRIIEILYNRGY